MSIIYYDAIKFCQLRIKYVEKLVWQIAECYRWEEEVAKLHFGKLTVATQGRITAIFYKLTEEEGTSAWCMSTRSFNDFLKGLSELNLSAQNLVFALFFNFEYFNWKF